MICLRLISVAGICDSDKLLHWHPKQKIKINDESKDLWPLIWEVVVVVWAVWYVLLVKHFSLIVFIYCIYLVGILDVDVELDSTLSNIIFRDSTYILWWKWDTQCFLIWLSLHGECCLYCKFEMDKKSYWNLNTCNFVLLYLNFIYHYLFMVTHLHVHVYINEIETFQLANIQSCVWSAWTRLTAKLNSVYIFIL